MANTRRRAAATMVAVGALLIAPHTVSGAETMGTSGSHVRSNSAAILALIQQATEGSTTFRHLLEVIDANDAIVYVQEGRCGHGVRACFYNVTSSVGHRSLWVRVDTTKNVDWNLMGSIGHELRHTIEVLDEPSVINGAAMFCLYQRIGYHGTKSGMETRAAVDAGQAVREEVRAFNRRTKTEYAVLKTVEGRIMMKNTLLLAACATAMLSLAAVPHANAGGTESHEMYLTFSAPFALPGVSLPAGTYAFELLNNQGVLKAVRVTSKDGLRVYLTALTLTVSRPIGQPKDRLISFAEVETGRTPVVQAWYPKDDSVGHEFIYPKHRPQVATH